MKKSLFFAFAWFISFSVFGQASWNPPSGTNFSWIYNMDASKSNQIAGKVFSGVSSTAPNRKAFMPAAPSGTVKVAGNPEKGQNFTLIESGTDDKLKMNASPDGSTTKFSIFSIDEATALTATYFTLNFENNLATRSDWVMALGYQDPTGVDTRFKNGRGVIISGYDADFFACMKVSISKSDPLKMTTYFAGTDPSSNPAYVSLGDIISRGTDYRFEILCNNTASDQSYKRGTTTYKVPKGFYHVWVNDARLAFPNENYDLKANGLARETNINSIVITGANCQTNGVASSDGSIELSKLSMQFSMSTLVSSEKKKP